MHKLGFNALATAGEFRLKVYPVKYQSCVNFYKEVLLFPVIRQWNGEKSARESCSTLDKE